MRALISLLAVAALAAALPAAAQDTGAPGCTQARPCKVIVDLDGKGIDIAQTDFTAGDWLVLSVYNGDNVSHTVSLDSPKVSVTVGPDDIKDTAAFVLDHAGSYAIKDSPTGDSATLTAAAADSFSGSSSSGSGGHSRIPALAPALVIATLGGLAIALRRR
jgi:hypothetical protein